MQGCLRVIYRFLFALQFLTILPVRLKRSPEERDITNSTVFFPFVGLIIGIILYIMFLIFKKIFPVFLSDSLLLSFWVLITGAMHLDGVADVFDGFYGGKERNEVLRIMRDPHHGAIGTIGLVVFILLKFAGIHSLPQEIKPGALLILPAVSRGIVVILLYLLPYARDDGKAKNFTGVPVWNALISTSISFVLSLLLGINGMIMFLLLILLLILLFFSFKRVLQGITGDCIGFSIEAIEIASLIYLCGGIR